VSSCSVTFESQKQIPKFRIPANDEDIGDIEFTVTTLNCTHNNESAEHTTPPHERKRFSSLRKTGALGKAVRQRLSKSMYQGNQPSEEEKHNTCIEEKVVEEKPPKPEPATSVATATTTKEHKSGKLHKKKSKLCSLL
jgi:cGMP-specific 3',5'-cyclic phosphodiesterase, invertebrate